MSTADLGVRTMNALRYLTESGIEVPAVTAGQMKEIDRIAMEETGPNLLQMMENAGRSLALLTIELMGESWTSAPVTVLAGGGGNGGGGICCARHLANRGVDVRLCLAEPDRLQPATAFQRRVFSQTGGREVNREFAGKAEPGLIIDALIGYGLASAPHVSAAGLIRWANDSRSPILSLDIPSGVEATTGETPGDFVRPNWTMALALPKTGLLPARTGNLFLADLGIPHGVYRKFGLAYRDPFGRRYRVHLTSKRGNQESVDGR